MKAFWLLTLLLNLPAQAMGRPPSKPYPVDPLCEVILSIPRLEQQKVFFRLYGLHALRRQVIALGATVRQAQGLRDFFYRLTEVFPCSAKRAQIRGQLDLIGFHETDGWAFWQEDNKNSAVARVFAGLDLLRQSWNECLPGADLPPPVLLNDTDRILDALLPQALRWNSKQVFGSVHPYFAHDRYRALKAWLLPRLRGYAARKGIDPRADASLQAIFEAAINDREMPPLPKAQLRAQFSLLYWKRSDRVSIMTDQEWERTVRAVYLLAGTPAPAPVLPGAPGYELTPEGKALTEVFH